MNSQLSKAKLLVVMASKAGCVADKNGVVYSKRGRVLSLKVRNNLRFRYLSFRIRTSNTAHRNVYVHRLVAYQKFGDEFLNSGLIVRHLDGNAMNNAFENIALGTDHDNSMDRPRIQRQRHAAKVNQKYSEEEISKWRQMAKSGKSHNKISKELGVNRGVISYYLSTSAKRHSFSFPHPDRVTA